MTNTCTLKEQSDQVNSFIKKNQRRGLLSTLPNEAVGFCPGGLLSQWAFVRSPIYESLDGGLVFITTMTKNNTITERTGKVKIREVETRAELNHFSYQNTNKYGFQVAFINLFHIEASELLI